MEKGRVLVIGDRINLPLFRSVGMETVEAGRPEDVIREIRAAAERGDVALVIVLKHVAGKREDDIVRAAEEAGVPVLVLPTPWAPAEKINVEKLLARALGLG